MNNSIRDKQKIPPRDARYVVLDTETTGLDVSKEHILELSAVEIINAKITGNQFHFYIKPRKKIDEEATKLHGLSSDFFTLYYNNIYPNEKKMLVNLLRFIGESFIMAHNADFDKNFINKELEFFDLPLIANERFICTMKLYKSIFTGVHYGRTRLSDCCEKLKIKYNKEKNNFHTAMFDAFMAAKMVCILLEDIDHKKVYKIDNFNINKSYLKNTLSTKQTGNPI